MTDMNEIDWASLRKTAEEATQAIAEGEYDLLCTDASLKFAQSGNPMIIAQFVVESGPAKGRMLFTNIVFSTEKAFALAMWFQKMDALGLDADYFAKKPTLERVATDVKGRRIHAKVGQREYEGKTRNEITQMMPASGPAPSEGPSLSAPSVIKSAREHATAPVADDGPPLPF
jgi:hypothetical protein